MSVKTHFDILQRFTINRFILIFHYCINCQFLLVYKIDCQSNLKFYHFHLYPIFVMFKIFFHQFGIWIFIISL